MKKLLAFIDMAFLDQLRPFTPAWLKRRIPAWVKFRLERPLHSSVPDQYAFLDHPLELPEGQTEKSLFQYLASFHFEDGPTDEMHNYLRQDFRRFLYTLGIIPQGEGALLEIGANPYFTSMLIKKFSRYRLYCTNFFGDDPPKKSVQFKVNGKGEKLAFEYVSYNVESDELPFAADSFDVILCCEIIEHLTNDPIKALLNFKTMLKNGGYLILTTPNVARLENVYNMIAGLNIYDPYSGYGPYGRHNREYNKHELYLLLSSLGFEIEIIFTTDVNDLQRKTILAHVDILELVKHRKFDLGQYIFIRAKNTGPANVKKPKWLYRSYPAEEMSE
jgi:SAM-dependent methyltransferase